MLFAFMAKALALFTSMAEHNKLGKKGEEAAAHYLTSNGHQLIERNWRFQGYEIDIISLHGEFIVFTEVKTRTTTEWGYPEESVDRQRMRRMARAANIYVKLNRVDNPVRFDIVAVVWNRGQAEINHIEDAFLPFLNH